jgi:hypothetical protein
MDFFGFNQEELNTIFNTFAFKSQSPEAFLADVLEIRGESENKAEFESLLRKRCNERILELDKAITDAGIMITADPDLLPIQGDRAWGCFVGFCRHRTAEALL